LRRDPDGRASEKIPPVASTDSFPVRTSNPEFHGDIGNLSNPCQTVVGNRAELALRTEKANAYALNLQGDPCFFHLVDTDWATIGWTFHHVNTSRDTHKDAMVLGKTDCVVGMDIDEW